MPNYDYKCKECSNVFEIFHSMSEDPKIECPDCSGLAFRTISKSVGISFRGSGFYVNDSSGSKKNTTTKTETKSKKSKPAAKKKTEKK